jgi:hypothetical protein
VKAYKGIVQDGVVVLLDSKLPEGAVVTVTVGEGELLRATIHSALSRPKKAKIRINPTPLGVASRETESKTPSLIIPPLEPVGS